MCRTGELVLKVRFKPPDRACDRRTYRDYVRQVLARDVTMDELKELCAFFVCAVEQVETKIVDKLFGKGKG